MKSNTSNRLKQIMSEQNLKQVDILRKSKPFQEKLAIKMSKSTLSQYVNGIQSPDQDRLFLLSKTLNISEPWLMGYDVPKERVPDKERRNTNTNNAYIKNKTGKMPYEDNQVQKYLSLVSYRKARVDKVIDREFIEQYMETGTVEESNDKYIHSPNISIITGRKSAAGETLEVDDDLAKQEVVPSIMIPKGADELVEITGDSMEPLINKGEKVYIRHQAMVENGEIAIVRIEEHGVTCKRVYRDNGVLILRSENNKYDDLVIEKDEVVILAKVLLK